ncbi:MAG TPA: hypothetical protein VK973_10810, partial [Arenicellales bacterium]|nr:hypothetical protein [Arenicellales bacterium]
PVLFIILLVAFIALVVWLAPKIWRGIKAVFRKIGSWFSSGGGPAAGPQVPSGRDESADSSSDRPRLE